LLGRDRVAGLDQQLDDRDVLEAPMSGTLTSTIAMTFSVLLVR
jgi:hypothetical protein